MSVSVILTVLNEGEALRPLLESWLTQTRPADEIVIVDGGSVDVDSEDYEAGSEASSGASWTDPLTSLDRSEASGYSEWPSPLDL